MPLYCGHVYWVHRGHPWPSLCPGHQKPRQEFSQCLAPVYRWDRLEGQVGLGQADRKQEGLPGWGTVAAEAQGKNHPKECPGVHTETSDGSFRARAWQVLLWGRGGGGEARGENRPQRNVPPLHNQCHLLFDVSTSFPPANSFWFSSHQGRPTTGEAHWQPDAGRGDHGAGQLQCERCPVLQSPLRHHHQPQPPTPDCTR